MGRQEKRGEHAPTRSRFWAAIAIFLDPEGLEGIDTTQPDDRETRIKYIGVIEGKFFVVVYTMRGAVTRIISACRANAKEIRAYGNR